MATMQFDGLDKLALSMEQMAAIPADVKGEMLQRGAKVAVDAQRRKLESYVGQYAVKPYRSGRARPAIRTGQLAQSIQAERPKITSTEASIQIAPKGSRTRGSTSTDNREIAYILEYGKRGVPARPFMRDANAECEAEVVEAAAGRYSEWLDEIGL